MPGCPWCYSNILSIISVIPTTSTKWKRLSVHTPPALYILQSFTVNRCNLCDINWCHDDVPLMSPVLERLRTDTHTQTRPILLPRLLTREIITKGQLSLLVTRNTDSSCYIVNTFEAKLADLSISESLTNPKSISWFLPWCYYTLEGVNSLFRGW